MALRSRLHTITLVCLCLLNAACTLPRAGALSREIDRTTASSGIEVVPINQVIALGNRASSYAALPSEIQLLPALEFGRIMQGDHLGITVIEGSSPTVPSAIGGKLELPRVDVAPDGTISVPFAGRLMVAGQSIDRARQTAQEALQPSGPDALARIDGKVSVRYRFGAQRGLIPACARPDETGGSHRYGWS